MRPIVPTLALVLAAAACGGGESAPSPAPAAKGAPPAAAPTMKKTAPSAGYPLDVCVVTGEKLGAMGEPIAYTYGDVEVQFCCGDCIDAFKKDPEKYLAKIRAAAKK